MLDLLQEYKDLYYKEIEHNERLNSKITFCVSILTIIGGAIVFEWSQIKNITHHWYFYLYVIFAIITTAIFIICLFKFKRAYMGYKVHYYPIEPMHDSVMDLLKHYKIRYPTQNEKHTKVYDYASYMMALEFLKFSISNRKNNNLKNERYRRLVNWIIVNAIFAMITYALYIIINYIEPNELQEVIVNVR